MAETSWSTRLGAWVGGFGVPGGFDATSGQRRLKGFATSRAHVNALIAASGPEMNARARWLVRNNGYAVLLGSLFGIAESAAAIGDPLILVMTGIYDLPKTASQA